MSNIKAIDFDEIISVLKRNGYEEIKISRNKINPYLKSLKSFSGIGFELNAKYDSTLNNMELTVYCLEPVPEEKLFLGLQLINYCCAYEEEALYIINPTKFIISWSTWFCLCHRNNSLGDLINWHSTNSIENMEAISRAIKNNYVENVINPATLEEYLSGENLIVGTLV